MHRILRYTTVSQTRMLTHSKSGSGRHLKDAIVLDGVVAEVIWHDPNTAKVMISEASPNRMKAKRARSASQRKLSLLLTHCGVCAVRFQTHGAPHPHVPPLQGFPTKKTLDFGVVT